MPLDITDALLDALAQRESHNDPNALGDRGMKYPAYGAYQMRLPAYLDIQQSRPEVTEQVPDLAGILGHPDQQRLLAKTYLELLRDRYGLKTVEEILAGYNAGPTAVRKKRVPASTRTYVQDILNLMTPTEAEE